MKPLITLLLIMTSIQAMAQNGKAKTIKKTFKRTTSIQTEINASPQKVWNLLTDAANYTNWNSTITSLEGNIVKGEKIKLKSTLDPKRTFKLKVKELIENKKLVWGDMMGKRTYTLTQTNNGTLFSMTEKIGGLMFPLFAKKIPSFDASFEQFASDLKIAAEK